MLHDNLFLPICGSATFLGIVAIAIVGMRARMSFARRLSKARRDEGLSMSTLIGQHRQRIRVISAVALVAVLGTVGLVLSILGGLVPASTSILILLITVILIGTAAGVYLLATFERLIR